MDDVYRLGEDFVDSIEKELLPNINQLKWRLRLIKRRLESESTNRGFSLENISAIKDNFKGDSLINSLFRDNAHYTLFMILYDILYKALEDLKLYPSDGERYYTIIKNSFFNDVPDKDTNIKNDINLQNGDSFKKLVKKAIYQYAASLRFYLDEFIEQEKRKKVLNIKHLEPIQEPCCNQ